MADKENHDEHSIPDSEPENVRPDEIHYADARESTLPAKTDRGQFLSNVTGSQIYSFVTFLLSFFLAFGDDGFNFLGFVFLFAFFWLIAIPFRVLGWFSFRMNSRACAVCGNRIKNGKTTCSSCGTDFRIR